MIKSFPLFVQAIRSVYACSFANRLFLKYEDSFENRPPRKIKSNFPCFTAVRFKTPVPNPQTHDGDSQRLDGANQKKSSIEHTLQKTNIATYTLLNILHSLPLYCTPPSDGLTSEALLIDGYCLFYSLVF